jgi:hypothetical protein
MTGTEFTKAFDEWQLKWAGFLNEKTVSVSQKTGKRRQNYTHKRLRSAWLSIKRHLLICLLLRIIRT